MHVDIEQNVECPFSADLVFSPKLPVSVSPSLAFILFVNGRCIQHTRIKLGIRRVLEQYYYCSDTNTKSRNQNTFCFLSIWIDSSLVDVNVHPNKREVCFLDEDYVVRRIVDQVEAAIEQAVSSQSIGGVQPSRTPEKQSRVVKREGMSQNSSGSKKVRVDYSQRTLTVCSIESSPAKEKEELSCAQSQGSEVETTNSASATPSKQTLSMLSDFVNETPYKPTREDLQLDSVLALCQEVKRAGELCTHDHDVLQKSVFISCLNDCLLSVVQYENTLLLLRNGPLLWCWKRVVMHREEFFYQLIIFNFGCFYKIRFMEKEIDVKECIQMALDAKKEEASVEVGLCSSPHIQTALSTLSSFAQMLKDYFSISFETASDGRLLLRSLPLLLVDFEPFYGYLPLFLYRLGVEVSYSNEQTCLYRIAKELAQFYAYLPASGGNEEVEEWKNVFQSALYPQLKRQMIVNDRLWGSGTIQLMASTDRLYRVFERCSGV